MPKLAVNGGKPVRKKSFPSWPQKNPKELVKLKKVWESGKWGVGSPFIKEFEEKFSKFYGSKYALTAVNGTTSMWIGLRAAGVKIGDEVIIPPYTFFATAVAVLLANATPEFVDVDPNTGNIDPDKIEQAITPRTKAIIPVHIGGMPCEMEKIMSIAKKYNLLVIEDAAQAHYAEINHKRIGSFGDLGSFSFQLSKNMTAGEGGILISDNKELLDKCFSYQNCGRIRKGIWYEHLFPSGNNRMTAFQAAILTEQLKTCDIITTRREKNATYLAKQLSKLEGLIPQRRPDYVTRHAYHLFIFKYKSEFLKFVPRDKFLNALSAEGIPCSAGYSPLYSAPVFKDISKHYPWLSGRSYTELKLANTEKLCNEEMVWLNQNLLIGNREDINSILEAIIKIKENIDELL
jgi:dTDP-4-amino-4,6-dideoxygalactose transaminase